MHGRQARTPPLVLKRASPDRTRLGEGDRQSQRPRYAASCPRRLCLRFEPPATEIFVMDILRVWTGRNGHVCDASSTIVSRRRLPTGRYREQRRRRVCWRASCRAASRRYYDRMAAALGRIPQRRTSCRWCRAQLVRADWPGRPALYCSSNCRRVWTNEARLVQRLTALRGR